MYQIKTITTTLLLFVTIDGPLSSSKATPLPAYSDADPAPGLVQIAVS